MERLTMHSSKDKENILWAPKDEIAIVEKLASYEDTGLTPDEINGLQARLDYKDAIINTWESNAQASIDLIHRYRELLKSDKEELQAYKDAEEQGLLIKRRIKPLDKVYHIIGTVKPGGKLIKEVRESVIYSITEYAGGILQGTRYEAYDGWNFYEQDIGVKAFITIEAAEEALKGGAS
jgi:urease accessory protein UreH